MKHADSHLSDQQLLLDVDGELSRGDEKSVRTHLAACWQCRARLEELQNAISDFVRAYQGQVNTELPPVAGPRALLKARMAQLAAKEPERQPRWFLVSRTLGAVAICAILIIGFFVAGLRLRPQGAARRQAAVILVPDSRLTPGAALLVSGPAVCAQPDTNNKAVPISVRQKVFEEYGIRGADPRAYEVDYLVTPALGGADDIHNLWPHSYSTTVWNARVKDALENRLRAMVCDGSIDLTEAQREIAANWIAAYKKYFHTDTPLAEP
jgi:anti-sigma factor RsiW